ncbi:nitroreductase family protein [Paenibacillus popilliae]|uniref:Nitroreductase n=1 Tax=Paenibacillus popilliae ATCC 14706 TaxID=1212764 RepID=M9LDL8_PAEPP|nr:nitroreductase family protein [Paenibacillus popilliae]GAC44502.1 nitroreductase [Paenibacillus popilliae ATCC 14706]
MKTIEKATKLITHASVKITFEDNSWYIHNLLSKKTMKTSYPTCMIIISVNYTRKQWRYRHERELRNTYITSAQICQKFLLAATKNNLFCNVTPANRDRKIIQLLSLDHLQEQVLYTINVGYQTGGERR